MIGFRMKGSVADLRDPEYLEQANSDRQKRNAVGVYVNSGLSAYTVPQGVEPNNQTIFTGPQGEGFPVTWDPRYTIANGWVAIPDHRENYEVPKDHERLPAVSNSSGYFFNPADSLKGFAMTGNLDVVQAQGVHSLVCAWPH